MWKLIGIRRKEISGPESPARRGAPDLGTPEAEASKGLEMGQNPYFGWVDGFDYLRVIFMMSVILNHCNFVTGLARDIGVSVNVWDIVYLQVQSCAVPVFVLVSMLLFVRKVPTWERTVSRLRKLAYLYVFWVGAWVMYAKVRPEPGLWPLVEFLLRGGGWVYYFIVCLILCTPLAWFAARLPRWGQWIGLALASAGVAATFAYLAVGHLWTIRQYYWLPTSFFMMPFGALLIRPYMERLRMDRGLRLKWISAALLLSILCAVVEWRFSAPGEAIGLLRNWVPKHARLSIQFGAAAFVFASFGISRHPQAIMSFLARNSLGIYCMHPFVLGGFIKAAQTYVSPHARLLAMPAACVSVIFCCGFVAEFLRRAFRQRLV